MKRCQPEDTSRGRATSFLMLRVEARGVAREDKCFAKVKLTLILPSSTIYTWEKINDILSTLQSTIDKSRGKLHAKVYIWKDKC